MVQDRPKPTRDSNCTIAAQSRSQCVDGCISNIRANEIHDETKVYFYSDQRWNEPSSAICVGRMHLCHLIVLPDVLQGTQRETTTAQQDNSIHSSWRWLARGYKQRMNSVFQEEDSQSNFMVQWAIAFFFKHIQVSRSHGYWSNVTFLKLQKLTLPW